MQNLSQLNCFIKVAEFKNFTMAAKMLHLSTTAVSKQIKNLEHLIGEQVLIRNTRKRAAHRIWRIILSAV